MLCATLICNGLIPYLKYGDTYPDVSSLGIFKKLAVIELQIKLAMGINPREQYISSAKKILKASVYSGVKVIKFRVLRVNPTESIFGTYNFIEVETLDITVV